MLEFAFGDYELGEVNKFYPGTWRELHGAERVLSIIKTSGTRGMKVLSDTFEGKVLELTGFLKYDNAEDMVLGVQEFITNMLKPGEPLIVTNHLGEFVYDGCYVTNPEDVFATRRHDFQSHIEVRLVFLAPKGFARTTTRSDTEILNITSLPYNGDITIDGDTDPEPVILITLDDASTIMDVYFTNVTTNQQISVQEIAFVDGDVLTIDIANKQVLHNTEVVNFNGVFPDFIPGVNSYQITAAGGATNESEVQEAYNDEETVYGNKFLAQSFEVDGNQDISQVALLVKKVAAPQTRPMEVLVVAGGGGAGGSGNSGRTGGGGGAGGLVYKATHYIGAGSYPITIGAGGSGGGDGGGSQGVDTTFNSLVATGGGGGGSYSATADAGGSGGGGGGHDGGGVGTGGGSGTSGTDIYGNNGGSGHNNGTANQRAGGGGGGANAVGAAASAGNGGGGGAGKDYSASFGTGVGSSGVFAGGGGGYGSGGGAGGAGGGGAKQNEGTVNTGGGGGANGAGNGNGSPGGSGVVIVRYLTADFGTITGGTPTIDGAYTQRVFTADDTMTIAVPDVLGDLIIEIQTDTAGEPSGTPVTNAEITVPAEDIGTSFNEIIKAFATNPTLAVSTVYHLVVYQDGGDIDNYYVLKKQNTDVYPDGNLETTVDNGANWTQETEDLYFKLWSTLPTGFDIDVAFRYFKSYFNVG